MVSNCVRSSGIPHEPALGEHPELRGDQLRLIAASHLDKDEAGKSLEIIGEQARAACRAQIPV
jgi:hypothetical protein